jgi:hypothetical protein
MGSTDSGHVLAAARVRQLKCAFNHTIADESQGRVKLASAGRSTCSAAQDLQLMSQGDVLEDQQFAIAKGSSDQV